MQQTGSMSFTVPANTKNQIYDAAHPTWYAHDAAGNMTGYYNGLSTQNYTWDAEGKMKTAGGYTYTYDANGMRVRKRQDASPNAWTEYLYFGSNVLAERDQAGTWTDYIFAGGKRIAKAPASAATTGTEYYHGDHLGSARLMTNASGNQTWSATYLPFGQEWNPATTTNHYKFTGKERDTESGLDYFGARYYGSRMGRWLTPDWANGAEAVPYADFGDPQSLNLYGYVGNKPVTRFDADGHCPWCVGALVGAGIGGGYEAFKQWRAGQGFNFAKIGAKALQGGVTGAVAVATGGTSLLVQASAVAATSSLTGVVARAVDNDSTTKPLNSNQIAADFAGGAVGGAAGKIVGGLTSEIIKSTPTVQGIASGYADAAATSVTSAEKGVNQMLSDAVISISNKAGDAVAAGIKAGTVAIVKEVLDNTSPEQPAPDAEIVRPN
ncbi:MAG: RHS domain-containing protein [Acidobacteriales bacterium]|nr:RHS domain-containing protein [Terriglobales bacterium]